MVAGMMGRGGIISSARNIPINLLWFARSAESDQAVNEREKGRTYMIAIERSATRRRGFGLLYLVLLPSVMPSSPLSLSLSPRLSVQSVKHAC